MLPAAISRQLRRLGLLTFVLIAGLTCRDRNPLAPGLPGRAALDVAPLFETAALGGPVLTLAKFRALLIGKTGEGTDTVTAESTFDGDSAVLRFEVVVAAPSELFVLEVEALDARNTIVFRGTDTVRVAPGTNPARGAPAMRYVAPDTAVRALVLSPLDTTLDAGDTLRLAAKGVAEDGREVSPLAVGWLSRDPRVAAVSPLGTVTARELEATAWIVARTFTGVADSVHVHVRGGIAAIVMEPDSAVTLVGSAVVVTAEARDAVGTTLLGRDIVLTNFDPDIATLTVVRQGPALAESSTSTSAAIGANGTVSASVLGRAPGVARIAATAGAHADTVLVRVDSTAGIIVRTAVEPAGDTLSSLGDTLQLHAASYDAAGTMVPGVYTWKARDPSVASVSSLGTVVALADGETWIVVTEEKGTADSALVVVRQRVASAAMQLTPTSVGLGVGGAAPLTRGPMDANRNPVQAFPPATCAWTIENASVARVDKGPIIAA